MTVNLFSVLRLPAFAGVDRSRAGRGTESGKQLPPHCHRGIFISRRRNENVRDLPRQRGVTPTETHDRLSAEVADIFRRWRDGKFRDDN